MQSLIRSIILINLAAKSEGIFEPAYYIIATQFRNTSTKELVGADRVCKLASQSSRVGRGMVFVFFGVSGAG